MTFPALAAEAGSGDREAAPGRARALVVVVLCLLGLGVSAEGVGDGGWGEAPFIVASMLPAVLYVFPAARAWARLGRYRFWLLAAQAAVAWAPLALFGKNWAIGPQGWLAGLVLVFLPGPGSWLAVAAMAAADEAVRAGLVGLPWDPALSGGIWVLLGFADNALAVFGLAWLCDLVGEVQATRGELAEAAVAEERLWVADNLRSAIGDRLATVGDLAEAARRVVAESRAQARTCMAAAGSAAREALAEVRAAVASMRESASPAPAAARTQVALAPRLALAVLTGILVVYAAQGVNNVALLHVSPLIIVLATADMIGVSALQLRHSWPRRAGGRPRGWPVTLAAQALLCYVIFPAIGWTAIAQCAFVAGSALLLLPRWRWWAFAAVAATAPLLWVLDPIPRQTPMQYGTLLAYLTLILVLAGLLVYALSWLAQLAVALDEMRDELARTAVLTERLRVARDTHDLLGMGLSAIALKADLVRRLIGRDDARAATEIGELTRICATARTDIRLVTGESRPLTLAAELATARELLDSAGIEVSACADALVPDSAQAVLVPVLREAVTNVLRHSSARHAVIEIVAQAGMLRLRISNDGVTEAPTDSGRTGHGLANLTARVEAAGGRLTSSRTSDRFELEAQIPVPVTDASQAALTEA